MSPETTLQDGLKHGSLPCTCRRLKVRSRWSGVLTARGPMAGRPSELRWRHALSAAAPLSSPCLRRTGCFVSPPLDGFTFVSTSPDPWTAWSIEADFEVATRIWRDAWQGMLPDSAAQTPFSSHRFCRLPARDHPAVEHQNSNSNVISDMDSILHVVSKSKAEQTSTPLETLFRLLCDADH